MDEQETQNETPKRKGWPRGKPRGPRKHPDQVPLGDPTPLAPEPVKFTEPIIVRAILKTGQAYTFEASKFETSPVEYRFWALPLEKRGHKTLHVVSKSELSMISIEAPEIYFEAQRVAQETVAPAPAPTQYPGGDPTVSIAPRHLAPNRVQGGMGPGGVPISVGKVYDKGKEVEQVIGAGMVAG